MAWHYGTYSCGHEGKTNIIGKVSLREWKAERHFEGVCSECFKKQFESANIQAAEAAKEMELPELKGSPKQVAWANTLRLRMIDEFEEVIESLENLELRRYFGFNADDLKKIVSYILEKRLSASYYIENRENTAYRLSMKERKEALKSEEEKKKENLEEEILQEIKMESTVFPEEKISNGVAEILFEEDEISVKFERNDIFINIVKSLGYCWDQGWRKPITATTGSAEERAAELGNKLLNAGIPIRILDENVRKDAVHGNFEPECFRWIYRRKGTDKLAINWTDRSDLFDTARSLPGARWSNPSMLVTVEHYQEIEEFAELYGFKFSKNALELIESYKRDLELAQVVTPAKVEEKQVDDGLKKILESGDEIIDDLLDD